MKTTFIGGHFEFSVYVNDRLKVLFSQSQAFVLLKYKIYVIQFVNINYEYQH